MRELYVARDLGGLFTPPATRLRPFRAFFQAGPPRGPLTF